MRAIRNILDYILDRRLKGICDALDEYRGLRERFSDVYVGVLRGDGSHAPVIGPRRLNRCCDRGWEVCDDGRAAVGEDVRR